MITMKILGLILENFAPILAGTGKERIELFFRESNDLISVFIGKIGSGKTYILSHLQPFSTVGSLDVRNADDPILPEKDGLKIIEYEKDGHEYTITHKYTWGGNSHSKKSYIEKDGIELNPNGNSGSFKDIILTEFGIDQSFLSLIRLGPNVNNFINMKTTERKAYIASKLASTEVYLVLHKHWSQELRTINTSINILMNKLSSYGNKTVNEISDDIQDLEDEKKVMLSDLDLLTKKKYTLEAETNTMLNNRSINEYLTYKESVEMELNDSEKEILEIKKNIELLNEYPDINEISKMIGKYDSLFKASEERLAKLENEYNESASLLNNLKDKKAMSSDDNHMELLKETYEYLKKKHSLLEDSIRGFKCKYSSAFLSAFNEDLNLINVLISEICQYDKDTIKLLLKSDNSVIKYSKEKIEILGFRKLKLQKEINNLEFSKSYEPANTLYFPPLCPTKNCPYYKTHPYTIQKTTGSKNEFNDKLVALKEEIQEIDVEVYKLSDYPILYSKISSLREYWKKSIDVLKNIGALRCDSLEKILLFNQYQEWYSYNKIVDTIDLIEKVEQYSNLTDNIKQIKSELSMLEMAKDNSIDKQIEDLSYDIIRIENELHNTEKEYSENKEILKSYNDKYLLLSDKAIYESKYNTLDYKIKDLKKEYEIIISNISKIDDNKTVLTNLDSNILLKQSEINKITNQIDSLVVKINDMKYTNEELDKLMEEQKYMSYMVDAVGSKKGIPLAMVQLFLESCRDTLNEMLYTVCEDELEILPFNINETEFKIPFMVNGQVIDDISKASQGQSSIVSTTMSFALVKQTGSYIYNIPLLDEMDAPLHKNDKQKFIAILLQYLKDIGSEQCFMITHDDNTFDGHKVQVIMTTDEIINKERYTNVIKV